MQPSQPAQPLNNESNDKDDGQKKRGCTASNVWSWFTNDQEPHTKKSAICKNCNTRVNHKKSESAHVHLNKCKQFQTLMNDNEESNRNAADESLSARIETEESTCAKAVESLSTRIDEEEAKAANLTKEQAQELNDLQQSLDNINSINNGFGDFFSKQRLVNEEIEKVKKKLLKSFNKKKDDDTITYF